VDSRAVLLAKFSARLRSADGCSKMARPERRMRACDQGGPLGRRGATESGTALSPPREDASTPSSVSASGRARL
jgi:hypothetical protein